MIATRAILGALLMATASAFMGSPLRLHRATHSRLSMSTEVDVDQMKSQLLDCKEALRELIDKTNAAPIMVRLAWHDSGTHDANKDAEWPMKGGADGSIRFDPEITHGANAGLTAAFKILEPLQKKHSSVSWADIIQMASAVSIELTGGPKIPMRYGRVDIDGPEQCTPEGNLPDGGPTYGDGAKTAQEHLRNVFHRMGFNDQEIVALSGAHTLGRAYKERSGYGAESTKFTDGSQPARKDGKPGIGRKGGSPWTADFLTFNNKYYENVPDEGVDPELLKLDTDKTLFIDEGFLPSAQLYKKDEAKFFEDYAKAHAKLSELGSKFTPEGGVVID